MWSVALYSLRICPDLFWQLTPRQFDLLTQRHHEELCHREMTAAFTTAAIINHSFSPPEKPIPPIEFMPNYRRPPEAPTPVATEAQQEAKTAFDGQVAQLTAEMKAYAETGVIGPALKALGYGSERLE